MVYSVSHDLVGHVTAIGDLNVRYSKFVRRISAVGEMEVMYHLFGRVRLIDNELFIPIGGRGCRRWGRCLLRGICWGRFC
jgi:hypothetical protein